MVKLFCAIVGAEGSAFSVTIDESESVGDVKKAIKAKNPGTVTCDARKLQLFLAEKDAVWLESGTDDVKKLKKGEKTAVVQALIHEDNELQGESGLRKVLARMPPPSTDQIHVLMVVPEGTVGSASETSAMAPVAQMTKKLDEVYEHVVGTKRKRYVHSQVGMEKGRQLLQVLNIWVEPVPTVVSAVGIPTPVDAFDWESVVDGNGREIALCEDQQRAQYREYMERNIGAVLAEKNLCVLGVENIPDLLTVQVPGLNIELAGRTDLLILSDVAKKYPSELPLFPGVKMLIEVKKAIATDSSYQALSELIALDLRSDDPVMALLTNLTDNWQFFWVSEKSDDCATIHKATIKKPGEAFRVIKALLAQPPTADEVNLPYIQGPVKRRKLAQLLPCIDEGGESGGNRECIERYYDIASVLGPDVEMARAVGRQIARSIPAYSMYS